MTPYQRANAVQEAVEAAMGPGGRLYVALSDLVTEAEGVALDADDAPDVDDRGAGYHFDAEKMVNMIRWTLAEHMHGVVLRHATREEIKA